MGYASGSLASMHPHSVNTGPHHSVGVFVFIWKEGNKRRPPRQTPMIINTYKLFLKLI